LWYNKNVKLKDKTMEAQENPQSASLVAMAGFGQWVVAVGAALIIGYCIYLLAVPAEALFLLQREVPNIQTLPSHAIIAAATAVAALPVVMLLAALLLVWRFFSFVKHGQLYSLAAQQSLKWLGRAAIGCAVTGMLTRTVIGILLSSANPPGQKMLVIGISSGEVASVVIGLLVFVFANVVREAAAIAHENASFV
jgi:Protein of unknown function (DUF2975)